MSAGAGHRLFALITHLIAVSALFGAPAANAAVGAGEPRGVLIRVEGEDWGSAEREEVEAVLYAVADQLVAAPAAVFDRPIVVTHAPGSPVTLYERGPSGEYQVRLSARDRRWAQYAYQFGHELCHIMSNYAAHDAGRVLRRNQWFEEALCETAALYTLRSLARSWRDAAPYTSWEAYAPVLAGYADRLIAEPHRHLPVGLAPSRWLAAHLDRLARDPYRRKYNEVVATLLLPLFEREPAAWASLHALNRDPRDAVVGLARYLQNWKDNAEPAHRGFIAAIAQRLEVHALNAAPSDTPADAEPTTVTARPSPVQAGRAGPSSW
ncbi:MAG TPA: hypothetical protein PL143_15705 [Rhodocyclaceae bacterium]|nr:hypothetical protein [Rhodocyclaceae bacterium]